MRSYSSIFQVITRGISRNPDNLRAREIKISRPLPPLPLRPLPPVPEIVVSPPQGYSTWGPDQASPSCAFPYFVRDSDNLSELTIVRRKSCSLFRAQPPAPRPRGPRPAPPLRFTLPLDRPSSKRHAVASFSQLVEKAEMDTARNVAMYQESRRLELWDDVQASVPSKNLFVVVVPASSIRKEFKFGQGMQYEEMFRHLVDYLANETRRTSPAPMVFLGKNYTEAIYDAKSYKAWLQWMKVQDPKDRVLIAV